MTVSRYACTLALLVQCGGATRHAPEPCPADRVTVRLAERELQTPYTNEEFTDCQKPTDPALDGLVWCCPYETP